MKIESGHARKLMSPWDEFKTKQPVASLDNHPITDSREMVERETDSVNGMPPPIMVLLYLPIKFILTQME